MSTAGVLGALAGALGNDQVREGGPADAVGGLVPAAVAAPADLDGAAAALGVASHEGLAVLVRGGGSKAGWGAPPGRLDVVLETSRLDAVVAHEAADFVLTCQAGVTLARLGELLAPHRQRLCLDPPEEGATLGGVIATGAAGPLRFRYGTPRDLVLGATAVLGDGTVARAGGKVVKNVAGYDLAKLYCGSFGTLALVGELTVRLHPAPPARATLRATLAPDGLAPALSALRAAQAASEPSALELDWPDSAPPRLLVLLEGRPAALGERLAALQSALSPLAGTETLGGDEAAGAWAGHARFFRHRPPPPWARLHLSLPPAGLAGALAGLRQRAGELGVACDLGGAAGNGSLDAVLSGRDDASLAAAAAAAAELAGAAAGFSQLRGADPSLPPAPPALPAATLALMAEVKRRFDPAGVLAPGRLGAGW